MTTDLSRNAHLVHRNFNLMVSRCTCEAALRSAWRGIVRYRCRVTFAVICSWFGAMRVAFPHASPQETERTPVSK